MKMQLLLASLIAVTLLCNTRLCFTEAALQVQCRPASGGARFVGLTGASQFKSVQAAINSVPPHNDQWTRIIINPGIYREQVQIPWNKPCIVLDGGDRKLTIITYDAHELTDTSATFTSFADNIVARGITFKNDYNRNWLQAALQAAPVITQAVAARIIGDKSVFLECGFEGVQDTLFDALGRHYFKSCYIEGAIDFIFGDAQSFYEDCLMNATVGMPPYNLRVGFVTAQGRSSPVDPSGFVFEGGAVVSGRGQLFLGRAYRPYSRVIFHKTQLSANVAPAGWNAWHARGQEKNLIYAEVDCTGVGAQTSNRVPWLKHLDPSQLQQYSRSSFIDGDGWLATTPLGGALLDGF